MSVIPNNNLNVFNKGNYIEKPWLSTIAVASVIDLNMPYLMHTLRLTQ